jgi:hypothetical protein
MKQLWRRLHYSPGQMTFRPTLLSALFAQVCLAATPADSSLNMRLDVYGTGAESVGSQSRIAGTEIEASLAHRLSPDLQVRVAGGVQLEAGAARARWSTDFQPRQIQRLREAVVHWTPLAEIQILAGAVDQTTWESPLLLQRQSFPALVQRLEKKFGSFSFLLHAQQAVPVDTSSLQPWGNWPQGMPGFYMERLGVAFEPSEDFRVALTASHFLYENLSGPNAFQAQFLGNTVSGIDANTRFVYGFTGFEWAGSVSGRTGRLHSSARASLLKNAAAPHDKSTGWRLSGSVGWDLSATLRLSPQFEWFRVDSDTAPAFYTDRIFGHTNRAGFGVALVADWKSGVGASVRWVHSNVLASNPYQSNLDWVQLQLSTQYAVF